MRHRDAGVSVGEKPRLLGAPASTMSTEAALVRGASLFFWGEIVHNLTGGDSGRGATVGNVVALVDDPVLGTDTEKVFREAEELLLKRESEEQRRAQEPTGSAREEASGGGLGAGSRRRFLDEREPGDRLGRYEVLEVLGSGSNGVTYRARREDGQEVAVKELSLRRMKDWKQLELFEREARILAALDHPGIPQYLDYFQLDSDQDRSFCLVQRLVAGASLADLLDQGWRVGEDEVVRIAEELLELAGYLGGLRPPVIHRDIKPENIIIEGSQPGGRVFLVDFGGVQAAASAGERMGSTIVGTFGFMAPEQFRGTASPASDLYAVGATLLYLLSGRPPSDFPTQAGFQLDWEDSVPCAPRLRRLLRGLLQPMPDDRPSPAKALAMLKGEVPEPRPAARALQSKQPVGGRCVVKQTASTLDVFVPPKPFGGEQVFTGTFAVAWNAFVAFWTFSALASGGIIFALFSLPFWYAGWSLSGQFLSSFTRESIRIGASKFRISKELALLKRGRAEFQEGSNQAASKVAEGRSDDLRGARQVTTVIINGVPQYAVELIEGTRKYTVAEGLEPVEQEWLVGVINQHLEQQRGDLVSLHDVPMDEPRVVDDNDDSSSQSIGGSLWNQKTLMDRSNRMAADDDDDDFWKRR